MYRALALSLTAAAAFALAGCYEPLDANAPLDADIRISAGHIHALETDVTYTVRVTYPIDDKRRRLATDFETLAIEQSLVGTTAWRRLVLKTPVELGGYSGTHRFINPGSYVTRLVGKRAGQVAESVIRTLATSLDAVRSHWDAGGYRVEFDISPGFPDELVSGKAYTLQFYIMQAALPRPPVTGLTGVMIRCTEVNGTFQDHPATEVAPGLYQATHTFTTKGAVNARASFTGTTGAAAVDMPLDLQ